MQLQKDTDINRRCHFGVCGEIKLYDGTQTGKFGGGGADGSQMETEGQRKRRGGGQEGDGSWVNPSVSSSRA